MIHNTHDMQLAHADKAALQKALDAVQQAQFALMEIQYADQSAYGCGGDKSPLDLAENEIISAITTIEEAEGAYGSERFREVVG